MTFRTKLTVLFFLFALVPLLIIVIQEQRDRKVLERNVHIELETTAQVLADFIDRNLFERYSDAQSFTLSLEKQAPELPFSKAKQQEVTQILNRFVQQYQLYKQIILFKPDGSLVTASNQSSSGLPTELPVISPEVMVKNSWFQAALTLSPQQAGSPRGGTLVIGPGNNLFGSTVNKAIDKTSDILFVAPIRDYQGNIVMIWVNLMNLSVIEQIFVQFHQDQEANGFSSDKLTLLDGQGHILLDYPPDTKEASDSQHSLKLNQMKAEFEMAKAKFHEHKGVFLFKHDDNQMQIIGYAHSRGIYGYSGSGWSVLVHRTEEEAFANIAQVRQELLVLGCLVSLSLLGLGMFLSNHLSMPLKKLNYVVQELSEGNFKNIDLEGTWLSSEVVEINQTIEVLRERLQERQLLQQQESFNREALILRDSAINAATIGIVISDALATDMPLIYANDAFLEMVGYTREEVLGKNCRFLQANESNQEEVKILQEEIKQGKQVEVVLRNYRKNGEMFWNHLNVAPVRSESGQVTHFIGIQTDVSISKNYEQHISHLNEKLEERIRLRTEELDKAKKVAISIMNDSNRSRKQAEEALVRLEVNEARIRSILENMVDAVITIDQKGLIQFFSDSAEQMFGYTEAELTGKNVKILMPSDLASKHDEYLSHYAETGKAKVIGLGREVVARRKDGGEFPVELSVAKVSTRDECLYTGVIRDITERKRSESELMRSKEAAESANQAKSAFLATMSHEIRTPMNGVVGMLDLLQHSPLNDEQQHLSSIAKTSALALLQIINDVLDFSKIEAGKMTMESIPYNWSPIIEGVVELLTEQINNKDLKIHCYIYPEVSNKLLGDPARLRQIFLNLHWVMQ